MSERKGDEHQIVEEVQQPGVLELWPPSGERADDGHVDLARLQVSDLAPARSLGERQRHARMFGGKRRHRTRYQRDIGRREGPDAKAAALEPAEVIELTPRDGRPVEHRLGVRQQATAMLGELHSPRTSLEQTRAQGRLERGDLPRDR